MKKLLLLFCGVFLLALSYAQEPESKMKYVYSMEEALQKAKKENKLIFFNCYADWVVTCHAMDKQIFSDPEFADYMDKNFVNLFIDVEKKENKSIAEKYKISYFAHYLVLDSNGEIVHRVVGGNKLPVFKNNIALALNPKTSLRGMNARYEKGENSSKFYRDYLKVLTLAGENDKYNEILNLFLAKIEQKEWAKAETWPIIKRQLKGKDRSLYFDYLIANKKDFVKNNGEKDINMIISSIYTYELIGYALGRMNYNAMALSDFIVKLNKANLPETDVTYRLAKLARLRGEKKYDEMMNYLQNEMKADTPQMIEMINLSFEKIRDATPTQKKIMIDYLTGFLPNKKGGTLNEYKRVISQVTESTGIDFFEGTFKDALALAKKENKLIFLDCYTSWCGPCKVMAADVFTQKEVGKIFNKTFVNVKMDMERGEGLTLAEKYKIESYPTMLLVDGDGNMVHKIIGGRDSKSFVDAIMKGTVKETSYSYLTSNVESIKSNPELYVNYLLVKRDALEISASDVSKQMSDYLIGVKNLESIATPQVLSALVENINDYRHPLIPKIIDNSELFKTKIGVDVYSKSMERILFPVLLQYFRKESNKDVYDEVKGMVAKMKLPTSILSYAVTIADMTDNNMVIDYYEKTVSAIKNPQDKLNIDLLLKHLARSMSATQLGKVKNYVAKAFDNADSKAKNAYQGLSESL